MSARRCPARRRAIWRTVACRPEAGEIRTQEPPCPWSIAGGQSATQPWPSECDGHRGPSTVAAPHQATVPTLTMKRLAGVLPFEIRRVRSGVRGTPTFYLDDVRYDGVVGVRQLTARIRESHPDLVDDGLDAALDQKTIPRVLHDHGERGVSRCCQRWGGSVDARKNSSSEMVQ